MRFLVVDANGFLSRVLGNYYLHLGSIADVELIWSRQPLHEVEKNAPKVWKATGLQAHSFVETMRQYHPEAEIQMSSERIHELRALATGVHHDDVPILATALEGGADVLATENIKHFQKAQDWMGQHGITLVDHGQALEILATENPDAVSDVHRYLLGHQYSEKGEAHVFEKIRGATKSAEAAIGGIQRAGALSEAATSVTSTIGMPMGVAYRAAQENIAFRRSEAEQRLGASDLRWISAHTRGDGTQIPGHWRRRQDGRDSG